MKTFYGGMAAALAFLLFMTWHWRVNESGTEVFYGIVDTTETVISAEIPVEVTRVHAFPGQVIHAGDTLVALSSGELERSIAELRHHLSEVRVDRQDADAEISAEVSQLEAQYRLNRNLLSEVNVGTEPGDREDASPLRAAITGLKGRLGRDEVSTTEMEAYLSLLLRERDRLTVVASASGVVGTVYRNVGEKVKAFEPVMTLHSGSPSIVRGYVHESFHGTLEPGRRVMLRSMTSKYEIEGELVGVGQRIVEYPVRLRKRPDIQVWGREVTVRISGANTFLQGEKVILGIELPKQAPGAHASFPGISAHAAAIPESAPEWSLPGIEASALVYLADLNKTLVLSDDTPGKRPVMNLVGADGRIDAAPEIQGLKSVNDMESAGLDASGRLYVATSQSVNKSGKLPPARTLLLRIARDGKEFRLDASVSLYDALAKAAQAGNAEWAKWLRDAMREGTLDMEGIAPLGGGLLLGFKAPLLNGRAVILKVENTDALFSGTALSQSNLSIWATPDLRTPSGLQCGVSDLFLHRGILHVLGSAVREGAGDKVLSGGGGWWTVDSDGSSRSIRSFTGVKPEGITYDNEAGVFRIAFDEGTDRPSRVVTGEMPSL